MVAQTRGTFRQEIVDLADRIFGRSAEAGSPSLTIGVGKTVVGQCVIMVDDYPGAEPGSNSRITILTEHYVDIIDLRIMSLGGDCGPGSFLQVGQEILQGYVLPDWGTEQRQLPEKRISEGPDVSQQMVIDNFNRLAEASPDQDGLVVPEHRLKIEYWSNRAHTAFPVLLGPVASEVLLG